MTDYKIFDESLPDSYIEELSERETDLLVKEATEEHLRLEKEIEGLLWPDRKIIGDDGQPLEKVWPSEYSYLPIFYRDEIAVNPGVEKKLQEADELSKRVGVVLAIKGTALTHKAHLVALTKRVERLQDQERFGF